jgi:hypothetical protein
VCTASANADQGRHFPQNLPPRPACELTTLPIFDFSHSPPRSVTLSL